jgi:hypothetical protein
MKNWSQQDITTMLAAWKGRDAGAADRLMDFVYPELRRLARRNLERKRANNSLDSANRVRKIRGVMPLTLQITLSSDQLSA